MEKHPFPRYDHTYDSMMEIAKKYTKQWGVNIYVCEECGHRMVTRDVDKGVTPFLTACPREACKGWAQSSMYRVPQDISPSHEWYRPTREEFDALDNASKQYCGNGGLLLRKNMGRNDALRARKEGGRDD